MLIGALTYLISFTVLLCVARECRRVFSLKEISFKAALQMWKKDFLDGLHFVFKVSPIWGTLVLAAALNFFTSWKLVSIPIIAKASPLGAKYLGLIEAMGFVGQLLAFIVAGFCAAFLFWRPFFAVLSLVFVGISICLASFTQYVAMSPLGILGSMLFASVFNMLMMGQFMLVVPPSFRSRVGSFIVTVCQVASPLGVAAASSCIDSLSVSWALRIAGSGIVVLAPFFS